MLWVLIDLGTVVIVPPNNCRRRASKAAISLVRSRRTPSDDIDDEGEYEDNESITGSAAVFNR